jgi:hypothetical protein
MSSFSPIPLHLPQYPFRIKRVADKTLIFDQIRKKFIVLTPEEWVRQHMVQYLIHAKGYPRTLIQLEGGLKLNALQKRTDILLYNDVGKKIVLVECKSPAIKINQETFDQIARYNTSHLVEWLLVSNGLQHYCCQIDFTNSNFRFSEELPDYQALKTTHSSFLPEF